MKKFRKMLVVILILSMMSTLFIGCSNNLPDPKNAQNTAEQENVITESDDDSEATEMNKTEFEGEIVISIPTGGYTTFMDEKIIPDFEKEYPNVKVSTITDENVDTRIAAGDVPNVMTGVFGYMPAKYAKMDLLVDYKELNDYEALYDRIMPEFVLENFNGLYYVPWNATTQMMIYNKELFAEAGLDPENPPKTFDEYLEASRLISELPAREDGSKVYGSVFWNDALSWGGWYWTMMSQIYYNFNDGQYQLFNEYGTDIVINNPEANFAEFLSFMKNVQETAPPTMEMNFFSRNIGMWLQYGYGWKTNLNEAPGHPMVIGEDVGVAPIPTLNENGNHWSTLDGRSLMIFKTTPMEEAISWEFVKFLMRDDYNLEACKDLGQLPTLTALKDDPYFMLPENKPFVDQLSFAVPNEPVAEVDQISNILLQVYSEVVIDQSLSPEDAVEKISEEAKKILDQ